MMDGNVLVQPALYHRAGGSLSALCCWVGRLGALYLVQAINKTQGASSDFLSQRCSDFSQKKKKRIFEFDFIRQSYPTPQVLGLPTCYRWENQYTVVFTYLATSSFLSQVTTPPGLGKILADHLFWSPELHTFHKSLGSFLYHIYHFNLQNSVHLCSAATSSVSPVKMKAVALLLSHQLYLVHRKSSKRNPVKLDLYVWHPQLFSTRPHMDT